MDKVDSFESGDESDGAIGGGGAPRSRRATTAVDRTSRLIGEDGASVGASVGGEPDGDGARVSNPLTRGGQDDGAPPGAAGAAGPSSLRDPSPPRSIERMASEDAARASLAKSGDSDDDSSSDDDDEEDAPPPTTPRLGDGSGRSIGSAASAAAQARRVLCLFEYTPGASW